MFTFVIALLLLAAAAAVVWAWIARRQLHRATGMGAIYRARTDRATALSLVVIFVGLAILTAAIEALLT